MTNQESINEPTIARSVYIAQDVLELKCCWLNVWIILKNDHIVIFLYNLNIIQFLHSFKVKQK